MFINARSILNNCKIDELTSYVVKYNLHIIGVAETWLNDNVNNVEINLENFSVFRKDRSAVKVGKGGGVMLYIHNSIKVHDCQFLNKYKSESLWCKLVLGNGFETILGVVYRSPNADDAEVQELCNAIRDASCKQVIIMGDFNLPDINWESLECHNSISECFMTLVQDTYLVQHVNVPTRGDNILDLVLSSEQGMIEELKVIEHLANSDHNIVLFKAVVATVNSASILAKHNYNLGDYDKINQLLNDVPWDSVFTNLDANAMWELFLDKMSSAVDSYIPLYKHSKRKYPQWMTKRAKRARKYKSVMWSRFKCSNSYNDRVEYKKSCKLNYV